jgi:hypothetical protein
VSGLDSGIKDGKIYQATTTPVIALYEQTEVKLLNYRG